MIDPDELRDYVGAEEADEATLTAIEQAAVAFVQNYTGRYFGPPELVEEYVTGRGGRRLYLRDHVTYDPSYPDDPAVVLVDERTIPGDGPTAFTQDTDFVYRALGRENVLIRFGTTWGQWTEPYEYAVTYWRGYPPGDEPADIRQLVKDMVLVKWQTLQGDAALQSETIGGYSYTRFKDADMDAVTAGWDTLALWKPVVFA
jgi:hypothetical protein